MAKKSIGLKKVEMGAIAGDGDMGTVLTILGPTVSDTAVLSNGDPTVTEFKVEESSTAFYSESEPGAITMTWSIYDVDPQTLTRLFGGDYTAATTLSGAIWEMPDQITSIEQSVKVTTKDEWVLEMARMKIDAKLTWNFKKTALAQVDITGTILIPTKTAVSPLKITDPYKSAA